MRPHVKHLFFGAVVVALMTSAATAADPSPVGRWRTFSVRTGRESGMVEISQVGDTLVGKVVKIIQQPGDPVDPVCDKCDGPEKNQRVLGMTILKGLHRDGDAWDGGTILDPRAGTVYSAEIHLEDAGRALEVRGFLGVSLLGHTVTWQRAE
jgi:uncharacterized protein (DUF2147 family)